MIKVNVPADCGNAPRKELIRDFNIAFAENKTDAILDFMADDITWHIVGLKELHGKAAVKEQLASMGLEAANELIIQTIVTHGDTAAANGEMKYNDTTIAFCDIYKFTGHDKQAKIKTLTSYGVELTR